MLKITSSLIEHIELAEYCYFRRDAQCRIRVMEDLIEHLDDLRTKASRFHRPRKEGTDMACGTKKGKKGKKGKK